MSRSLLRGSLFSLSGDSLILGHGHVLANTAERTNGIIELLGSVDAFTHWKRVGVVKELHLVLASLTIVDSAHAWILLIQPTALNISLLLWVISLRVNLTDQVGDLVNALLLSGATVASRQRSLSLLEISGGCGRVLWSTLTKVVPILSAEVALIVGRLVSGDDGAEALGRGMHGSINERKLSDVVLVDHAENWLLLAHVDSGLLDLLLVRRLQLTEAVIADQMLGLLLRLAVDGTKGCGQTT